MPVPKRAHKRRSEAELAPVRREVVQLFDEAQRLHKRGKKELARRRVRQARRKAMKVQLRLKEYGDRFCRSCDAYLVAGENMTIRVRNGVRIRRCLACGAVRRRILRTS